jgi:hypothetical protein
VRRFKAGLQLPNMPALVTCLPESVLPFFAKYNSDMLDVSSSSEFSILKV